MKWKHSDNFITAIMTNAKLVVTIIPIVVVMILIFFGLTRNEILGLSKDRMALETKNCSENINIWTQQTLSELNIYKRLIEQTCTDDDEALKILESSYKTSDVYPMGLYMGDENGTYLDGSGWEPGEDFVVTERDWYKEGLEHDTITFGTPYVDAMTGSVCVSATSKIKYKSALSVISVDIYTDYASKLVLEAAKGNIEKAFCVSEDGMIVLSASDSNLIGKSLDEMKEHSEFYSNIHKLIVSSKTGQNKINGSDGEHYVEIEKLDTNDWYLVTSVSRKNVLKNLNHVEMLMLIVAAIASIILIFVTLKFSKYMSYIKNKARTDSLTNLLNRNGFRDMVSMLLDSNPNQGILIIIDMDNFKLINDQMGHPEGDKVLKRFAGVLEEYFNRNKDVVARIGGDEFAVFVGRFMEREDADAMLKKFISVFHMNFDVDYPQQKLSISIGAAYVGTGDCVYDDLYRCADEELYNVKRNGKDGFSIY